MYIKTTRVINKAMKMGVLMLKKQNPALSFTRTSVVPSGFPLIVLS